ncbi:hypothetical protein SARC_16733, partial [Sphaeroforma arctica JP610]
KDMGCKNVHTMGKNDAAINNLCAVLAALGTVATLYQMGSMSLGINKKGKD